MFAALGTSWQKKLDLNQQDVVDTLTHGIKA